MLLALTSTESASAIADSCKSSGLGGGDSSSSVSIGGGIRDLGVVGRLGRVDGDSSHTRLTSPVNLGATLT